MKNEEVLFPSFKLCESLEREKKKKKEKEKKVIGINVFFFIEKLIKFLKTY